MARNKNFKPFNYKESTNQKKLHQGGKDIL